MRCVVLALLVLTPSLSACVYNAGVDPSLDLRSDGSTTADVVVAQGDVKPADAGPLEDAVTPDGAITDPDAGASTPDTITPPDTPPPDTTTSPDASDDATPDDVGVEDSASSEDVEAGPDTTPPDGPLPGQTVWPVSFTNTLTGDGVTLQPLGTRRGFTGVLSAPDGTRLEALP